MEDNDKHTTAIPSGIAAAASYFFPFIGGLVMLALEKKDRFVRFDAAQSIVFWVAVFVLFPLSYIPLIKYLYAIAFLISWIFLMYQAWMGREFEIPYLGAIARKQVFGDEDGPVVEKEPMPEPGPLPEAETEARGDEDEGPGE